MSAHDNAVVLVQSIRDALARGVKHYSVNGEPLLTDKSIIEALIKDGSISFEVPEKVA